MSFTVFDGTSARHIEKFRRSLGEDEAQTSCGRGRRQEHLFSTRTLGDGLALLTYAVVPGAWRA